jgi:bifunctional non-homologous end joining protein LigD
LGCIDLNPWYARCDDVYRPDYLHFDLDPVKGTPLKKVLETALRLHEALQSLKISSLVKTTGSRGLHVYVPIVRGPTQKEVGTFSKTFARSLADQYPRLITLEYRIEKRPAGHVLVDYNQNAWGRTLASVYSVRPRPRAPVSMPVRWEEVRKGFSLEDFRIDNAPARIRRLGDLWKPLLLNRGRAQLERFL